jgi:hypothetical protein
MSPAQPSFTDTRGWYLAFIDLYTVWSTWRLASGCGTSGSAAEEARNDCSDHCSHPRTVD